MPMSAAIHKPTAHIPRKDNRKSAVKRGYNMDWRARRLMHLRRHPFCVRCGGAADTVDHIVRHEGDREKFNGPLQSMCPSCHSRKTAIETQPGYTYKPSAVVVVGEHAECMLFIAKQRDEHAAIIDAFGMEQHALRRIIAQIANGHAGASAWIAMPDTPDAFDAAVRMGGRLWRIGESEAEGDMVENLWGFCP